MSKGLYPSVGQFVEEVYRDRNPQKYVFFSDNKMLGKVLTSIQHHLQNTLGRDVTWEDIRNHGAIIKLEGVSPEKGGPVRSYKKPPRKPGEPFRQWLSRTRMDPPPAPVESGDYYSSSPIKVETVITGMPMMRLFRRAGLFPHGVELLKTTHYPYWGGKLEKQIKGDLLKFAFAYYKKDEDTHAGWEDFKTLKTWALSPHPKLRRLKELTQDYKSLLSGRRSPPYILPEDILRGAKKSGQQAKKIASSYLLQKMGKVL